MTTRPLPARKFAAVVTNLVQTAAILNRDHPTAVLYRNRVGDFAVVVNDEHIGWIDMNDGYLHVVDD